MNRTRVEWVKNPDGSQGYSWNTITGCLNTCGYCYARKLANGRMKNIYLSNTNLAPGYVQARGVLNPDAIPPKQDPFFPRFWAEKLGQPIHHRKPVGIFTCNMSDWCGIGIPENWSHAILGMAIACPQHRFYLLTKQPQNLGKFSPFPDNCWVGVTVCDKRMAFNADRYYFNLIISKIKFISFEPLLEDVMDIPQLFGRGLIQQADWVIIGSQTKPYHPPDVEWVKAIVEAADKAGVPVFMKNNLKPLLGNNLRQEMPII